MEKIDRKDFLSMAGGVFAGGAVGTLCSGAPFLSLQWVVEWTQDQYASAKGREVLVKSRCIDCGSDITIRMIGDRAVKVETSNAGCAMGQIALQELYHPERIKQPMKRIGNKGSGKFIPVSWDTAIKDISSRITDLINTNKTDSIVAITGGKRNASNLLVERLVSSTGSSKVFFEPSLNTISNAAVKITQRLDGCLDYDFENADYIISFGARILEGWGDTARIHKAFANWKRRRVKFVHIDTLCTRTASIADNWIPIRPGTEGVLALGIAHHLIKMGKRSSGSYFSSWSQIVINQYTPDRVSKITGISEDEIEKLAKEFASARRPLAVAGKGGVEVSSSIAEVIAVQSLNNLVNNFNKRGGVSVRLNNTLGRYATSSNKAKGLDDFIKNVDDIGILIINEANPVHRSVYGKLFSQKMKNIPMVVSMTPLVNDTAHYSDYILPTISSIEMATSRSNEPVAPRYESLHAGDIILKIAREIKSIKHLFPVDSYKDIIKLSEKVEIREATNYAFPIKLFKNYYTKITEMVEGESEYPLTLIPYEIRLVGDGSGLAFPYVLKSIDGKTLSGKRLWVEMNPITAKKHGVSEGSSIDIISSRGEIEGLKVHLTKTVAPEVVAIPLGFGHDDYTKYAEHKGINPKRIMSDDIDPISGIADWWHTRIKIS
ncbi:MAG: molybdopterin-dependent oxidoreductase [Spirochaetota bacterium]|nr:molybdopterin-dependent oxidoreductase [Spirochaetota bacterium]